MKILLLIAILYLQGCSWLNTDILDFSSTPVEKVPLILPQIDQFQYRNFKWIVVTPATYQEAIRILQTNGSTVLFALTDKGYENLSLNTSDILKLIKQQREIILAYEKYYGTAVESDTPQEDTSPSLEPDEIPEIE